MSIRESIRKTLHLQENLQEMNRRRSSEVPKLRKVLKSFGYTSVDDNNWHHSSGHEVYLDPEPGSDFKGIWQHISPDDVNDDDLGPGRGTSFHIATHGSDPAEALRKHLSNVHPR